MLLQVRVQLPPDVVERVGPQVVGLALLPPLLPLFWGHAGRGRRGALPDGQVGGGCGDGVLEEESRVRPPRADPATAAQAPAGGDRAREQSSCKEAKRKVTRETDRQGRTRVVWMG